MKRREEEFVYRDYVTRSLQIAPKNQYISRSWADLLKSNNKDTRTPEQIVHDIMNGAGLTFKQTADGMDGES